MMNEQTKKPPLHVVSLSGGKDSTAMLLMMVERHMPIDLILFCDTTMEFPTLYAHIDRLEKDIGIPITRIRAAHDYEYYMFDAPVKRKANSALVKQYGIQLKGNGWPGPRMRWCTSRLKVDVINRCLTGLRKDYEVIQYVGIAADEQNRIRDLQYPLVEWGVTEADALQYCYERGYDFSGLYELFNRVSCWCCPLQGLQELRNLRNHFPELWERLGDMDKRTWRKFRADYSVAELSVRFAFEEERAAQGLSICNRDFHKKLRERLESENSQ